MYSDLPYTQGVLYVRISAAIYNTLKDYEALAAAVEQITTEQITAPDAEQAARRGAGVAQG